VAKLCVAARNSTGPVNASRNATNPDEDAETLCEHLAASCGGAPLPNAVFQAHLAGDGAEASDNVSGYPWCCVRYVHVGKAAGSSFEAWVKQRAVRPPGAPALSHRGIDAITFHHPISYFLEHQMLQPYCIVGVTLRDPASLFWSQFMHCVGRACRRKENFGCGFLACVKGSQLHRAYESGATRAPAARDRVVDNFLAHPELWHLGRNPQTRHLGQLADISERDGVGGFGYDYSVDLTLESKRGQEYLARAKARLELFDFVLLVEDLNASYTNQLGAPAPSMLPPSQKKQGGAHGRLPASKHARVRGLNQLDVALYEFGKDIEKKLNARGHLAQYAALAEFSSLNGNQWTCLKMRRSTHPLAQHANAYVLNATSAALST